MAMEAPNSPPQRLRPAKKETPQNPDRRPVETSYRRGSTHADPQSMAQPRPQRHLARLLRNASSSARRGTELLVRIQRPRIRHDTRPHQETKTLRRPHATSE